MRQRSWFVIVALLLLVPMACKRDEPALLLQFDDTVEQEISNRVAGSFTRPQVSAAFDAFLEGLAADPKVQQRGEELVQRLMGDTPLAAALSTIMERLVEAPEVLAALQKLMAAHPEASQEQIGELFGEQFEQRWETPEVNEAWMAAYQAFVARLGGSNELSAVYRKITAKLVSEFDRDLVHTRKWNKRIIALNGGDRPGRAKASALYLENAWTDARIDTVVVKLVSNPTVRAASATLVAELLAIDPVVAELRRAATALASDEEVQRLIIRALQELYADELDLAAVQSSLRELLVHPSVVKPIRELLKVLATNPRVAELAGQWYDRVRGDAALARDFEAFWDGW